MGNDHSLEFLDYLVLIVKWKKLLIILFLLSILISYFTIYLFVRVEYEGNATIIPIEENQLSSLTGLVKEFSSLPFNISGIEKTSQMDLYNTIIYSRTNIDSVINRFGLMKIYKFPNREEAEKATRKLIKTDITVQNSFVVKVLAYTPQMAADMTNYVVKLLNNSVINLNISKARDNKQFLEKRYLEIKNSLRDAEDSLKIFQDKTSVFDAEEQIKQTIDAFGKLEGELASKQIEYEVLNHIYGKNSIQAKNSEITNQIFKNKINELETTGDKSGLLISLNTLPKKALNYFRYYRNVEIYTKMLEFILPMYEQSKFEEQKETPILQVIDYAVPPIKKAFPPRGLMSVIITLIILIFAVAIILIIELLKNSANPKVQFIKHEIFNFRKTK